MDRSGTDQRDAALNGIERLKREGDALALLFRRARAHFSAADGDAADPVELWGRRIGRTLAALAGIALCAYLYAVYVR